MTCYCHFRKQIYSKKAHLLSTHTYGGTCLVPHVLQEHMHTKTAVYCNYHGSGALSGPVRWTLMMSLGLGFRFGPANASDPCEHVC